MKAKCKKVRQKYYYKVLALRDIITGEKTRESPSEISHKAF